MTEPNVDLPRPAFTDFDAQFEIWVSSAKYLAARNLERTLRDVGERH